MSALFQITGPSHIIARFPAARSGSFGAPTGGINAGAYYYLGTAEVSPRLIIEPQYEPVINDVGSDRAGTDMIYKGTGNAVLMADINRFQYPVWEAMLNRPRHTGAPNVYGETLLDVAALVNQSNFGCGFELWVYHSYFGTANDTGDLIRGYYFPGNCVLAGPDDVEMGARVQKVRMLWRVQRRYIPSTGSFEFYYTNHPTFADLGAVIAAQG